MFRGSVTETNVRGCLAPRAARPFVDKILNLCNSIMRLHFTRDEFVLVVQYYYIVLRFQII